MHNPLDTIYNSATNTLMEVAAGAAIAPIAVGLVKNTVDNPTGGIIGFLLIGAILQQGPSVLLGATLGFVVPAAGMRNCLPLMALASCFYGATLINTHSEELKDYAISGIQNFITNNLPFANLFLANNEAYVQRG